MSKCIICRKDLNFFNSTSLRVKSGNTQYGLCTACLKKMPFDLKRQLMYYKNRDYRSFLSTLQEFNFLSQEQWNYIYIDDISSLVQNKLSITGYIPYDINNYVVIDENNSKVMLNSTIYNFSDIIEYEKGDDSITYDVQGPEREEIATTREHSLGRAVIGSALAGPVGALVGGFGGKKSVVRETSGKISYSTTVHEYVIRVKIKSLSKPIETLLFHNNENEMNEVAVFLEQLLSMR